jgi:hypothetical protein
MRFQSIRFDLIPCDAVYVYLSIQSLCAEPVTHTPSIQYSTQDSYYFRRPIGYNTVRERSSKRKKERDEERKKEKVD